MGIIQSIKTGTREEDVKKGSKEINEKSYDIVKNLITKLALSDEQVADIANVPVSFVLEVRTGLLDKK